LVHFIDIGPQHRRHAHYKIVKTLSVKEHHRSELKAIISEKVKKHVDERSSIG